MTELQRKAIEKHGQNLLAIFPGATERDPVKLCQKLRRLEGRAGAIALRLCNGPEWPEEDGSDLACAAVLAKVNKLLGNIRRPDKAKVPVFINRDPRGYALKIDDVWMSQAALMVNCALHQDWGGYGIIAPEIGPNGY